MKKNTLKKLSTLGAFLMVWMSLEASSLVMYQSDSDTEAENTSSSSSSTSTSGSKRKTKSKRSTDKKIEDLASFLLRSAKTNASRALHSSSRQRVAAELRYAACKGDEVKVRELLLNPDTTICDTDALGNTALHYAAAAGQENLLRILLDHAKQHKIQSRVVPPLQKSTERAWDYANRAKSAAGGENIKEYGAYLESDPEKISETVGGLLEGFFSIFLEPDDILKKRNDASSLASIPFIDIRNKHIATALHCAVQMGHLNCVRLLLDYRANLEVCALGHKESCQFHAGRPLHIACLKGHQEIAMLLLARKADFKALDGTKKSPLHAAAIGGCKELVQELLDRGAREVLTDAEGKTPVQYAYDFGHYAVAAFFLTYRGGVNNFDGQGLRPLHFAAMADDCALADRLEREGALLNPFDTNGFAPVHYAAKMGAIKMLDWCLDRVPYLSVFHESILCTAARAGQEDSMKCIMKRAHEIQPDPINIHSDTGLTTNGRTMSYTLWGLEERLPKFIDLLLPEGEVMPADKASIIRDLRDEAMLIRDLWKELGKKSTALEAYPDVETGEGATPLHLAADKEHKELFAIILRSIIAHELLRECKKDFKDLEHYFMRPKIEAYAKEVERINQRNAEARVKGYTEQEVPQLEPFDWKKDLVDKVVAQEKDQDKTIIEQYDDTMIWKIMSASCWLSIKDENEELSKDIIRLVETTIKKRILPLVKEERFRGVLIPRVLPLVNAALSRRGKSGAYANLTPPESVLIQLAVTERLRKEQLAKAQAAQTKANAADRKEQENRNLLWNHYGSMSEYYREQAWKYRDEKEEHLREVEDCTRRAEAFKEIAELSSKYKSELEGAGLVEKICKDWFGFV